MSDKHILIINGHPDAQGEHYDHALADAYAEGAESAKYEVKRVDVAALDFPFLRNQQAFETEAVPSCIAESQQLISWANHLLIVFPLWHGTTPAYFKAYIEQVFRYGFGFGNTDPNVKEGRWPKKHLAGKSARIVVTMGMPSIVYRSYCGGHGVKYLKRSVLGLSGVKPIKINLIGMVDAKSKRSRKRWIEKMRLRGAKGI